MESLVAHVEINVLVEMSANAVLPSKKGMQDMTTARDVETRPVAVEINVNARKASVLAEVPNLFPMMMHLTDVHKANAYN